MQPTIAAYCFLAIAIFFELVGTSLLIKTEQFETFAITPQTS
ncbi:hypothetical protein [Oligella urethralis]|nr:hypothetical protein [Oligella urethralis]